MGTSVDSDDEGRHDRFRSERHPLSSGADSSHRNNSRTFLRNLDSARDSSSDLYRKGRKSLNKKRRSRDRKKSDSEEYDKKKDGKSKSKIDKHSKKSDNKRKSDPNDGRRSGSHYSDGRRSRSYHSSERRSRSLSKARRSRSRQSKEKRSSKSRQSKDRSSTSHQSKDKSSTSRQSKERHSQNRYSKETRGQSNDRLHDNSSRNSKSRKVESSKSNKYDKDKKRKSRRRSRQDERVDTFAEKFERRREDSEDEGRTELTFVYWEKTPSPDRQLSRNLKANKETRPESTKDSSKKRKIDNELGSSSDSFKFSDESFEPSLPSGLELRSEASADTLDSDSRLSFNDKTNSDSIINQGNSQIDENTSSKRNSKHVVDENLSFKEKIKHCCKVNNLSNPAYLPENTSTVKTNKKSEYECTSNVSINKDESQFPYTCDNKPFESNVLCSSELETNNTKTSVSKCISRIISTEIGTDPLNISCENETQSTSKTMDDGNIVDESQIYGPKIPTFIGGFCEKTTCTAASTALASDMEPRTTSIREGAFDDSSPEEGEIVTPTKNVYGPALPERLGVIPVDDQESTYGPALPPALRQDKRNTDDEETIGPVPAGIDGGRVQQDLDRRAAIIKTQLENKESSGGESGRREEWMVKLPDARRMDLGLGSRKFRMREGPDLSDRSSWSDTPAQKEAKLKLEQLGLSKQENEDVKDVGRLQEIAEHDKEMERRAKQGRKREKSLLELHQKGLQKKKKKEAKERGDKAEERRPFSREIDLQSNRFDEAQKKSIIKKAQLLDSRFSSGEVKYL